MEWRGGACLSWVNEALNRLKALQLSGQQGAPPGVQQRRQVHRQLPAVAWRLDLCGSWRVSQSFPSWRRLQDEGIFQERGTSNTESSGVRTKECWDG